MKRSRLPAVIISLIIAASSVSLMACSKQEENKNNENSASKTIITEEKTEKIIFDEVHEAEDKKTSENDAADETNKTNTEVSDTAPALSAMERNNAAKSLYTNIYTMAMEYETRGLKIDGIISSDDNSDFIEEFTNWYTEAKRLKWSADLSENTVNSVVIGDPVSGYCGAYPNAVPENMNIPYSKELIQYSAYTDNTFVWQNAFPDCIADDPETSESAE